MPLIVLFAVSRRNKLLGQRETKHGPAIDPPVHQSTSPPAGLAAGCRFLLPHSRPGHGSPRCSSIGVAMAECCADLAYSGRSIGSQTANPLEVTLSDPRDSGSGECRTLALKSRMLAGVRIKGRWITFSILWTDQTPSTYQTPKCSDYRVGKVPLEPGSVRKPGRDSSFWMNTLRIWKL